MLVISPVRARLVAASAATVVLALAVLSLAPTNPSVLAVTTTLPEDVTVTVEPTDNLTNGQVITITITATGEQSLADVQINQCLQAVRTTIDFGADGGYCSESPLSPGADAEKVLGAQPPGTKSVTIPYKVGTGTQPVDSIFGDTRTLTCAPGASCFLSLWINASSAPELFFNTPLVFGASVPSTTTGGTAPATASSTTLAPGGSTATSTTAPTGSSSTTTSKSLPGTSTTTTAAGGSTTTLANGSTTTLAVAGGELAGGSGGGSGSGTSDGGGSSLPITGTGITGLVGMAFVLLTGGGLALLARQRSRS